MGRMAAGKNKGVGGVGGSSFLLCDCHQSAQINKGLQLQGEVGLGLSQRQGPDVN